MARCADGHVRAEETRAADALSGRALPPFARRAHQRSRARHRSSSLAQSSPATSHARRPGCLEARHLAFEPRLALDRQSAQNQTEVSSPTPRPLAISIANGVTESSPVQPQIMRSRLDLLTLPDGSLIDLGRRALVDTQFDNKNFTVQACFPDPQHRDASRLLSDKLDYAT